MLQFWVTSSLFTLTWLNAFSNNAMYVKIVDIIHDYILEHLVMELTRESVILDFVLGKVLILTSCKM